jgi:hypothetical protein
MHRGSSCRRARPAASSSQRSEPSFRGLCSMRRKTEPCCQAVWRLSCVFCCTGSDAACGAGVLVRAEMRSPVSMPHNRTIV